MKLNLKIWRQAGPTEEGHFEDVQVDDAAEQMSILELLDHVNEGYIERGEEPVCRSTAAPTARARTLRPASSVCSNSRTATP